MSGIRGERIIDENGNVILTGGLKSAEKIKERYGADYYSEIGRKGGSVPGEKGFASFTVGRDGLTGRERAHIAGAKGGKISRRKNKTDDLEFIEY